MAAQFHRLIVSDVRRETPDAVSIAFTVPAGIAGDYRFHPGQHLTLKVANGGGEVRRSYSICSGLNEGELRIAVKRVESGVFSCFINDTLKSGDEIDVMTPQGRFGITPDPSAARTYLAIAAGSGITPIISIIRSVLEQEQHSRFVLLYGNRTQAGIIFKDALDDLKDRFLQRLTVHHVLSREPQEVELLHGRIDAAKIATILRAIVPVDAVDQVFLCGPGGLIEEGRAVLAGIGVATERIHVEYFSVDGSPVTARVVVQPETGPAQTPIAQAHITLYGAEHDIAIFEGETVVDAGLRAGLEMPYSCRGGMCCTCRAMLTEGDVAMDQNYSLEPWEMEAGFVLTCQARPMTAKVALDYDQV